MNIERFTSPKAIGENVSWSKTGSPSKSMRSPRLMKNCDGSIEGNGRCERKKALIENNKNGKHRNGQKRSLKRMHMNK